MHIHSKKKTTRSAWVCTKEKIYLQRRKAGRCLTNLCRYHWDPCPCPSKPFFFPFFFSFFLRIGSAKIIINHELSSSSSSTPKRKYILYSEGYWWDSSMLTPHLWSSFVLETFGSESFSVQFGGYFHFIFFTYFNQ